MRVSRDESGLLMAEVAALRGTCLRRRVGCLLTDTDGWELALGRNGVAAGMVHCDELVVYRPTVGFVNVYPHACAGAHLPSGEGLDLCSALHAEWNALSRCQDVRRVETCYVTTSPCVTCVKMLMTAGCRRIVFREPYAHDHAARDLWLLRPDREWVHLPKENQT